MMRPIFNWNVENDANDPFPPKKQQQRRVSMLPQRQSGSTTSNNNKTPLTNNFMNRPSLTTKNRPSLSFQNRASLQNRSLKTTGKPQQNATPTGRNTAANSTPNNKNNNSENNIAEPATIVDAQSRLKAMSMNRRPLATINESPQIKQGKVHFELPDSSTINKAAASIFSNDSILLQSIRETSIGNAENELQVIFKQFQSLHNDTSNQLALGALPDTELKQLIELSEKLAIKQREHAMRQEQLQRARDDFIQTLTGYESRLKSEIPEIRRWTEQYNELFAKMERAQSDHSGPVKPIMVDKEIQAIPDPIVINKSPSSNENLNMRPLAFAMPESPILRTSTRKPPSNATSSITGEIRQQLDFSD